MIDRRYNLGLNRVASASANALGAFHELCFLFRTFSTASLTQAVLAELRTPHEAIELDIDAGDTRREDFLAINPNGRVPVIVHDGVPIWESAAITIYLGEVFGVEAGLYPPPGPQRGVAMQWIVWTNTTLGEAAGRLSAALPLGADGAVQAGSVDYVAGSDNEAARDKADLSRHLDVLEGVLSKRDYLNNDYTLADTHLWVLLGWIVSMGVDLGQFPRVEEWMARCGQRPRLSALFAG